MTRENRRTARYATTRRPRQGMTLIEIMMAMVIFAMISTILYGGFVQTARNKQRVEQRLDRAHEIRAGIDRMARELSMAFVSDHKNPNPRLQRVVTAFIGKEISNGSRLDFTSFSHQRLYRDAHESDQNELSYFVTQHPTDSSIDVLARREQSRIDDDPQEGGHTQILIDDVVSLELSFLDTLTGEWTSYWDTTQDAMHPNRLPSQVKILVTVPNLRGYGPDQTFGTRAVLPLRYALNHATYIGG